MFRIIGIVGLVCIIAGLLIKNDDKRYALFTVGGIGLLVYSIAIRDVIFIVLQLAFTIVSFVDFIKSKKKKKKA